jgi:6,7-dimethyl-8-ribityllumazine synthase
MVPSSLSSSLPANAAAGKKIALVVSRYHEELTKELHEGALNTLKKLGAKAEDLRSVWVPGAFEIPLAARALSHDDYDAIICLGVIIKGETTHDQYIAAEVARGISSVALGANIPVSFGVLTVQTLEQAKARCGGDKGHKGVEAAESAVSMIVILEEIEDKSKAKETRSVGFGGR